MVEYMKVEDLLKRDISVDVYDDVCEELAVVFEGAVTLTPEGRAHFAEALTYDCELITSYRGGVPYELVTVMIDGNDGDAWEGRLKKAKELFYSLAGYCPADDFDAWFILD